MPGLAARSHLISGHAGRTSHADFLHPIQAAITSSGTQSATTSGPQVLTAAAAPAGTDMTMMDASTDPGDIADLVLGGDPVDTTQTDSGDGWTSTETVHYVPNSDGSYTLAISSSDSYGDTSSAGSDISGMDPGSVPSGGTDSYSISISVNADGSMTLSTSQDSLDSYSESGTIQGSSDNGTWSGSGSDTYHSTDTITFNTDGSSTETSSVTSHSSDKYAFSDSGTSPDGGSFTLTGGGSDTFDDSEGDDADGHFSRHENDTESQHISLDGTGSDGAHVTADVSETVGYIDALTPSTDGSGDSSETVTKTDVGSETYSYNGSGTLSDGASFSGQETRSDTFNDLEIIVTATSGAVASQVSDDVTDQGTNQQQYDISVSGVPEDDGTSTDSEEDTGSSQGSYINTQHVSPGSNISSSHLVSSGSSQTSGTDSGGAFGSTGTSATDITITNTNGQITGDDQSPPPTPGTSFGSPPSGMQFNMDHYTVSMQANGEASDELGNDINQMNNGQLAFADGPLQGIKNRRAANKAEAEAQAAAEAALNAAVTDVVDTRLSTYTYAQALAVVDVGKLENIAEAYQRVHDSYLAISERLEDRSKVYLEPATMNMGLDLGFIKIEKKGIVGSTILGFLGDATGLTRADFGKLLDKLSEIYAEEAQRLESSIANINHAIVTLSDPNAQ